MRSLVSALTLWLVVVFASLDSRTALAQQQKEQQPRPLASGPGVVNDQIAYREFIILASIRDEASTVDRRRRDAFVKRIGLSPTDEASLIAALKDVRKYLEEVSAGPPQSVAAAAPRTTLAGLRNGIDNVFSSADARIHAFLSEDGWRRLNRFVREQVKPQTRVYNTPR